MATNNKKIEVPDIGNLLGRISEKRDSGELPKAPIQSVQPIDESLSLRKNVKTQKQEINARTNNFTRFPGGRPSVKNEDIEYVRLSPRIPKDLKSRASIAIIEERFQDRNGNLVKTMDELVEIALERLLG